MNDKTREVLTTKNTWYGFRPADLLGIVLMIVPCILSLQKFSFETTTSQRILLIFTRHVTNTEITSLRPGLLSSLIAVIFYAALLIRLDLFKADSLLEGIISVARTFLNCWALASLITLALPAEQLQGVAFKDFLLNHQGVLLLLALVLSWIGMRTISGYCWILFIIAAWNRLMNLDKAMEISGPVYVITLFVSLLLQIGSTTDLKDIIYEFRGQFSSAASSVRTNMSMAANDAAGKVQQAANVVGAGVSAFTPLKVSATAARSVTGGAVAQPAFRVTKTGATILAPESASTTAKTPEVKTDELLKALDLNGDGVVDAKDMELLKHRNK